MLTATSAIAGFDSYTTISISHGSVAGGWATLIVTGAPVGGAFAIQRHSRSAMEDLRRLEQVFPLVEAVTDIGPDVVGKIEAMGEILICQHPNRYPLRWAIRFLS